MEGCLLIVFVRRETVEAASRWAPRDSRIAPPPCSGVTSATTSLFSFKLHTICMFLCSVHRLICPRISHGSNGFMTEGRELRLTTSESCSFVAMARDAPLIVLSSLLNTRRHCVSVWCR